MVIKKLLLIALILLINIKPAYSDDTANYDNMSCSELRNIALSIHSMCIWDTATCEYNQYQYHLNNCENVSNSLVDGGVSNQIACDALLQVMNQCNFIFGALIHSTAIRDVWDPYVSKGCNVIGDNECSLYIAGVSIYHPCDYNSAVNDTTTYRCNISDIQITPPPPDTDIAPSLPPNTAPVIAPTVPAPVAPVIAPIAPAPVAPFIAPTLPAPVVREVAPNVPPVFTPTIPAKSVREVVPNAHAPVAAQILLTTTLPEPRTILTAHSPAN